MKEFIQLWFLMIGLVMILWSVAGLADWLKDTLPPKLEGGLTMLILTALAALLWILTEP